MADKFSIYRSFHEIAQRLDDAERLAFYDAIFSYGFDGVEPVLDGIAGIGFIGIKPNIDSSVKGTTSGGTRPNAKTPDEKTYKRGVQTGGKTPPIDGVTQGGSHTDKEKEKEDDKEKEKENDKDLKNSPYGENFLGSFKAAGGAVAGKPAPPACPNCDANMNPTNSFKSGTNARMWQCPLCAETVFIDEVA